MRARLISGLALGICICICGGITVSLGLPHGAFAASSQTVIRAFVGVDTTPPSTPALISATPVATSQISLLWTASIDDVAVAGYRVFRDGSQVATTTLTSFNDTGLSPATVYQYTVDAFDTFVNISSTSAPLSTSTFALIVPATTTPTTRSGSTRTGQSPTVSDIVVVPATQSAGISFKTAVPAQYSISWGRTTSYELGSLSTSLFATSHDTTIDSLEPGTTYWYKVVATSGQGRATAGRDGSFTTLPVFVTGTLMNVRNVVATVRGTDVSLRWLNPVLEPGSVVRVVQSHLFYPATPDSGALVYEGTAERVQDIAALGQRSPQYYTLFVIDAYGNYSSGAVVQVVRENSVATSTTDTTVPVGQGVASSSSTETGSSDILTQQAVLVRQGTITIPLTGTIELNAEGNYSIIVPKKDVTPHLKSIIVTVSDPTDQRIVSTYLLKLNQAGDAYEAVIQAPQVVGSVRFRLEVFDFNLALVRTIETSFTFVKPAVSTRVFPDELLKYARPYVLPLVPWLAGGIFLWWLILFFITRLQK